MIEKPISNKPGKVKSLAISFFTVLAIILSFHLWFISNTENIFEDIVSAQSRGKIRMKVKKVKFNYFSKNVRLQKVELFTTDTITSVNAYHFKVTDLRLKVKSMWSLIFNREIMINSLTLKKPNVEIRKIREESPDNSSDTQTRNKDISVAKELGKVYRSIQDALHVLNIQHFEISEGKFSLVNGLKPKQKPILISHIYLQIDNLAVHPDSKADSSKFLFSDNIILRTHNQEILFPDARHKLSFGEITINVKNKSIEIDSCELSGKRSDTGNIAFKMFFKKLQLVNLDFSALADKDLIKADSVYCQDPNIHLTFNLKDKSARVKKRTFQLNDALRQLGSNMELKFAGLKNADIEITTVRHNNPVTFSAEGNNVYLYDLKIDNEAPQPMVLGGFDVAIRKYEVITRDESTLIKFDSIKLRNNTVTLNNFSLSPTNKPSKRSIRNIKVPLLQLNGLSWEDLIVDHIIVAQKATFYNPTIIYKKLRPTSPGKKQNLFNALSGIDDFMEVNQLETINGHLIFELNKSKKIELVNTNFLVNPNQIVSSQSIKNIEKSVDRFAFTDGIIAVNNLRFLINGVNYISNEKNISAASVSMSNTVNASSALLKDVLILNLNVNEDLKKLTADGLSWQQGEILLYSEVPQKKLSTTERTDILIKNITARNTSVKGMLTKIQFSTFLDFISLEQFAGNKNGKIQLQQLNLNGRELAAKKDSLNIRAASYKIADNNPSIFNDVSIINNKAGDSLSINIPALDFIPSIDSLIEKKLYFESIVANQPAIRLSHRTNRDTTTEKPKPALPALHIENLQLNQPDITLHRKNKKGELKISLKNNISDENNDFVNLRNFQTSGRVINIGELSISSDHFLLTKDNKDYGVDSGKITMAFSSLQKEKTGEKNNSWKGTLKKATIKNLLPFVIKENETLKIDSVNIQNANFDSVASDLRQVIKSSPNLVVSNLTGHFIDSNEKFNWYNGNFDKNKNSIAVDSVHYRPFNDLKTFVANHPYQADYIEATSGKVNIDGFNSDRYFDDSIFSADKITFTNPGISIFRDKQLPFKSRGTRLLPTSGIKNMSRKISINTIQLNNAAIAYSELSNKTHDTAIVYFTRLNASLGPAKNFDLEPNDSLRLNAYAYLLDTVFLKLDVHQSYSDTLSGFTMVLQAAPFEMSLLNPVLMPLASAKINSGKIDTLSLHAIGKEYYSLGKMKIVYDNLNLQILKNGQSENPSLKTKLTSFIANTFLIRDYNRNRHGVTYFERLRDRSIFNYLVKITVSGFTTSVGAKSNKKTLKKYQHQATKNNIPLIDF